MAWPFPRPPRALPRPVEKMRLTRSQIQQNFYEYTQSPLFRGMPGGWDFEFGNRPHLSRHPRPWQPRPAWQSKIISPFLARHSDHPITVQQEVHHPTNFADACYPRWVIKTRQLPRGTPKLVHIQGKTKKRVRRQTRTRTWVLPEMQPRNILLKKENQSKRVALQSPPHSPRLPAYVLNSRADAPGLTQDSPRVDCAPHPPAYGPDSLDCSLGCTPNVQAKLPNSAARKSNPVDSSQNSQVKCQNLPERAHSPTSRAHASSSPIIPNHALNSPEASAGIGSMPPNPASPAHPTALDDVLIGENNGEYVVSSDNESDSDSVVQDDTGRDGCEDEYVVSSDSDTDELHECDSGELRKCNACHRELTKESYSNSQWKRFGYFQYKNRPPPRCRRCVFYSKMGPNQCGPSAVSHGAFSPTSSRVRVMPPSPSVSPPSLHGSLVIPEPSTTKHILSTTETTPSLAPSPRSSQAIPSCPPSRPRADPTCEQNRNKNKNGSTGLHNPSSKCRPLASSVGAPTHNPDLTMDEPRVTDPRYECQVCHRLLHQKAYSKTQFKRFHKITMKPKPSKAPPACRECINGARRGNGASAHPGGAELPGRSLTIKRKTNPQVIKIEAHPEALTCATGVNSDPKDVHSSTREQKLPLRDRAPENDSRTDSNNIPSSVIIQGIDPEPTGVHVCTREQKVLLPEQAQANDSLVDASNKPVVKVKVTAKGNNSASGGG